MYNNQISPLKMDVNYKRNVMLLQYFISSILIDNTKDCHIQALYLRS
jgi:hypothetical protein